MKKISIIITAYNVERFIKEAVDSALCQDYQNLEVLVINDASTDKTADIIQSFVDPRIRAIHLEENVGLGNALNKAIDSVTGEYFMFLDGDDRLSNNDVISRMALHAENNPDLVRASMRLWRFKKLDDGSYEESFVKIRYDDMVEKSNRTTTFQEYSNMIFLNSSNQFLIKKDWILKENIRFKLRHFEDVPFLTEMLLRAKSVVLTDIMLFDYRKMIGEKNSITQKSIDMDDVELYFQHVDIVFELFKKYSDRSSALYSMNLQRYLERLSVGIFRRVNMQKNSEMTSIYLDGVREKFLNAGINQEVLSRIVSEKLGAPENHFLDEELIKSGYYQRFIFMLENKRYLELDRPDNVNYTLSKLFQSGEFDLAKQYFELSAKFDSRVDLSPLPPGQVKKIYIHLGATKTGSTGIQNFLVKNASVLERHNIYVPLDGLHRESGRPNRTSGHIGLVSDTKEFLEQALSECSKDQALVLSTENLSARLKSSPAKWLEICYRLSQYEVIPIIYVKEQTEWISSMWAEMVTGTNRRWVGEIDDFDEEQDVLDLDYEVLFEKIKLPENVNEALLIPLNESVKGEKLIPSFLSLIGLNFDELAHEFEAINNAERNPGSPAYITPYIKALNASNVDDDTYKHSLRIFFNEYLYEKTNGGEGRGSCLSDEARDFLKGKYKESNSRLQQMLGYDVLFDHQEISSESAEQRISTDDFLGLINSIVKGGEFKKQSSDLELIDKAFQFDNKDVDDALKALVFKKIAIIFRDIDTSLAREFLLKSLDFSPDDEDAQLRMRNFERMIKNKALPKTPVSKKVSKHLQKKRYRVAKKKLN